MKHDLYVIPIKGEFRLVLEKTHPDKIRFFELIVLPNLSSFALFCARSGGALSAWKRSRLLEFAGKTLDNPFYFNTALDSNNLANSSLVSSGKLFNTLSARFSRTSFHHGSVSFLSY